MAIDKILERLDSLIIMGEKVLSTRYSTPPEVIMELTIADGVDYVDDVLFRQWRTSSLALLNALPSECVYCREFEAYCKHSSYSDAKEGVAILRAAKEDIEG
ncbi:unnamed protein product, partial [marine sediment metagenome]